MTELQKVCCAVLKQMKTVENNWGYHLSYSRESAWRPDARFLILTLNPSSVDALAQGRPKPEKPIYMLVPWALDERCDFFAHDYRISPYVRALFYELALLNGEKRGANAAERLKIAEEFADHHCPIASCVPYRTKTEEQITPRMWEFAEEKQWPAIFDVWLPEIIIIMGRDAYNRMVKFLKKRLKKLTGPDGHQRKKIRELEPTRKTRLQYEYSRFLSGEKTVTVIYIPHPTGAHGYKGLPSDLERDCGEAGTPFRQFLNMAYAKRA
ncbi:MAG: hypothetical protein K2N07_02340 [Desulfovibrio sp.]|nr:hypothetical protein [Desulfovibrio sp.]